MDIQGYRLLVGGFGSIHNEHSKGVERYVLSLSNSIDRKTFDVSVAAKAVKANEADLGKVINNDVSQALPTIRFDGVASNVPSPSWLLKDGDTVFAVLEDTNEVASLHIERQKAEADGHAGDEDEVILKETSRVKLPDSSGPTHAAIAMDPLLGRHLITADYGDGTVCVLPIESGNVLGPVAQVFHGDPEHHGPLPAQEGPHAHWILPLADGRVLSTDLGADRIYIHHWQGSRLVRTGFVSLAPGTGPRDMHVLPGPSGQFGKGDDWRIAVVDEWGCTVTILEPVSGDGRHGKGQNPSVSKSSSEQPKAAAGDSGNLAHGDTASADSNEAPDEFWVAQTVSLGGDGGEHPDQAASLAFVPDALIPRAEVQNSEERGEGAAVRASGVSQENTGHDASDSLGSSSREPSVSAFSRGFVYVGLRGSERIVTLYWDGRKLRRLAPQTEAGWKGRGISSGGKRPRHIVAIANMLIAANEVSDNLSLFRVAPDGEPVHLGDYPAGSPTSVLPLTRM